MANFQITALSCTDKTDNKASVSFVGTPPAHFSEKELDK
jgi:hypothetical protein